MRSRWQRLPVWQRALLLVSAWVVGFQVLGPGLTALFGPLREPWKWVALAGLVLASVVAAWFPGRRRGRDEVSR
jgi:hypothetical protein